MPKAKKTDPTLETSLNSDLLEEGFKNIFGETDTPDVSDDDSEEEDEDEEDEDSKE